MKARPKSPTAAEAVAKSREKTGSKTVAMTLRPEEVALLDELAAREGGRKAAFVAGLRALERGAAEPTPEEALRVIERALAAKPKRAR